MSTRGDAWRAIGNKLLNEGRIESGLCFEVSDMVRGLDLQGDMTDQLRLHRDDWWGGCASRSQCFLYETVDLEFGFPFEEGCGQFHEERAMGCYWMALEADEEDAT